MNRRAFLQQSTSFGAVVLGTPLIARDQFQPIRFGLLADLHHDLVIDGLERMSSFISAMQQERPDFILQLGDLCMPEEGNRPLMQIWRRFAGPKYHVLGNHDLERRYDRREVLNFWGGIAPYYSFDRGGYHFVVLDGNEINPAHPDTKEYPRYISEAQLHWLKEDLEKTALPTIVFCHQGLDADDNGIENAVAVRLTLESANERARTRKVLVVFSGHHHQDYHNQINGIHYLQINSASYHYQRTSAYVDNGYGPDVLEKRPIYRNLAVYRAPLWASGSINSSGVLTITGRQTTFRGRSPQELGMPIDQYGYPVAASISSRRIQISTASNASS